MCELNIIVRTFQDLRGLCSTVVYSLLDGFVDLFEPDSFLSSSSAFGSDSEKVCSIFDSLSSTVVVVLFYSLPLQGFDSLLATVLSNSPNLADDVWERNFTAGVSRHVRDTLYQVPFNLPAALTLSSALSRASERSCRKVV